MQIKLRLHTNILSTTTIITIQFDCIYCSERRHSLITAVVYIAIPQAYYIDEVALQKLQTWRQRLHNIRYPLVTYVAYVELHWTATANPKGFDR